MRIVLGPKETAAPVNSQSRRRRWRKWATALGALAVLFAFASSFFVAGILAERNGMTERPQRLLLADKARVLSNYLGSLGTQPERITLDIRFKHYQKLAGWREDALERGQITSDLKSYVPATIRYGNEELDSKVRLKGEWTDHVNTDKWSLRVKIRGDNTLFGMKRFSLQHPKTRSFVREWLYHQALARENVVSLRYKFVAVTVNGKDQGLYALEEGFGKQLVEHNQRREGVLVRFNGEYRYQPMADTPGLQGPVETGIDSEHASEIKIYDQEKLSADPALAAQMLTAHNLMEAFRAGELSTSEVFDMPKLASYFAVSELLGTLRTAGDWSDMRFLYNPISAKMEPIGVEGSVYSNVYLLLGAEYTSGDVDPHSLHALIFKDPAFFAEYGAALERVSQPSYVDALLTSVKPGLREQMRILHREWPELEFTRDLWDRNAATIRNFLDPNKGVHAYFVSADGGEITLDAGAIQALPVEILHVMAANRRYLPTQSVVLPGKARFGRVDYQTIRFAAEDGAPLPEGDFNDSRVIYRLWGTTKSRSADAFPWQRIDRGLLAAESTRRSTSCDRFSFVDVDEGSHSITFLPGNWTANENIVIPAGYVVRAGEAVRLNLRNGASLVSYSPLVFDGSEEFPVIITSDDATGGGVIVLGAEAQSRLRHVVFRTLREPTQTGWAVTGAVTFHESPVEFYSCEFSGSLAEDALNLVQSEFLIQACHFRESISDGLDVDFADGRLLDCSFDQIQGDGLDLSGSTALIEGLSLSGVADKAISVGEATVLQGHDIRVSGCTIGIASKDMSGVRLQDVTIRDAQYGLAVFQKKPEYGPASMNIQRLSLEAVETDYLVEELSSLLIDWKVVPAHAQRVRHLLYPQEMPDPTPPPRS